MLARIKVWIWCFVHLPRIWTRAHETGNRLERAEALLAKLLTERSDLLEQERQDIAAVVRNSATLQRDELGAIKRELLLLQRRLSTLRKGDSKDPSPDDAANFNRHDAVRLALLEKNAADNPEWEAGWAELAERLRLAGAGETERPVLDAGCGSGKWLELLRSSGLSAYGVDRNALLIERAMARGLNASQADVLEHLQGRGDASLSAITGFRLLEHLAFEQAIDFLDESLRVLRPGGVVILLASNPENMQIGAGTLRGDARSLLIAPELLTFLLNDRGFSDIEVVRSNPVRGELWLEQRDENSKKLNALLFGPQDFTIVARRP